MAGNDVFALAFNGLVRFDRDGAIVPDLALSVPSRTNGGISSDGLTLTYRLRRDVRWQDGIPFSARDVVFTWRALVDRRNLVPAHGEYDRIAVGYVTGRVDGARAAARALRPRGRAVRRRETGRHRPRALLEGVPDLSRGPLECLADRHGALPDRRLGTTAIPSNSNAHRTRTRDTATRTSDRLLWKRASALGRGGNRRGRCGARVHGANPEPAAGGTAIVGTDDAHV